MRKASVMVTACIIAACTVAGCVKEPVREAPAGPPSVTWEFNRVDRDAEPYTEAVLVISGERAHRHVIGVFYGKVRKILSPAEIAPEMIGGTISGFITVNDGRGSEVIVRYNEREMKLIVAERLWSEKLPPGFFRVINTITVPEMKQEHTGF